MELIIGFQGKIAAVVNDATGVPREGDLIWLNLTGDDELYKVIQTVWNTELATEGERSARRLAQTDVFVLVEKNEKQPSD